MTWRRIATVRKLRDEAGDFLAAREAEHNLILGLCSTIEAHPEVYPVARFFFDPGRGAALHTPPQHLLLSCMDAATAAALADELAAEELSGANGPVEVARAFAERHAARSGAAIAQGMRQRIFRLDRVVAPRPVAGAMRLAEERDRARLVEWLQGFHADAALSPHTPETAAGTVTKWLQRATRTITLWDDGGDTVSMAGAGGRTPNGIRIGPVYTPRDLRGRGYASNLVAATSQWQLDEGRRFCFLYTDLANPTSNAIYQAIGYRPVCDVDVLDFRR